MTNEPEEIYLVTDSTDATERHPSLRNDEVGQLHATTTNLDDVEDFSHVCRMCATVTEFVIPIFAGEGLQNNLAEKIHKHLPIQVLQEDTLPRVVCCQCASTLLAWHELVQCCVQADAALKSRALILQQSQNALNTDSGAKNEETDQQNGIVAISRCAERPAEPPEYPKERRYQTCELCSSDYPVDSYKHHLVTDHSDLLFHCKDCDEFIDIKDSAMHSAAHSIPYDKLTQTPAEPPPNYSDDFDARSTAATLGATERSPAPDFSDRSDAEDGFGPLPESVFDAIEDTQECVGEPRAKLKREKRRRVRTCPVCSKTYTAASSYFYHMKHAHCNNKEHACGECGARFSTRGALAQHSAVHSSERRYACPRERCDKRFRTAAALYIHTESHSGTTRHRCAQCGRAFRWRAALSRHVRRHAVDRQHVCSVCGRAFAVNCDLLRHARTHTVRPHRCPVCGATLSQLRYLNVHLRKFHTVSTR